MSGESTRLAVVLVPVRLISPLVNMLLRSPGMDDSSACMVYGQGCKCFHSAISIFPGFITIASTFPLELPFSSAQLSA